VPRNIPKQNKFILGRLLSIDPTKWYREVTFARMQILGIIGARSGSKGVPHKNVRLLAGRPLVGWIIEAAKASRYLDRVIVSTDSPEYACIARSLGGETPFIRPAEYATDRSTDYEYVRHAVDWLEDNEGYRPDIVVRMVPTVPLQLPEDIDSCIEQLMSDPTADTCLVVAEARQHPAKALKVVDDSEGRRHLVSYLTSSPRDAGPTNRQSYERVYFRANVVACKRHVIKEFGSLAGDRVTFHVIPQERALDIDSPEDFAVAEWILTRVKLNKREEGRPTSGTDTAKNLMTS
jgi:CMP-N,N'-diacetyllegionaminic acid synthase